MIRAQRRSRIDAPDALRSTTDAREIAKFAALAEQWWDPQGPFAALHRLNPLRLGYIRSEAARHCRRDPRTLAPFGRLALVDIGCGGGLLAEPLARQGFAVLGIDAAAESVAAAAAHADGGVAAPLYRCASAEVLAAESARFDVVLAMEIIEHLSDRSTFLQSCASLLKPGGLMFAATLNRTLKALALAKVGAEYVLGWIPRGTHDWNRFVAPDTLAMELEEHGLAVRNIQGVSFDPFTWDWRLSTDTAVNYMLVATK
jgi:2-polyprenyl-6-hydroxyphenyl methylase/3-demethylubiquinone-9 3-methyltransferase